MLVVSDACIDSGDVCCKNVLKPHVVHIPSIAGTRNKQREQILYNIN